jgi:hypothetical protein
MASFAFLACEDTGTNNPAPAPVPLQTGCKVVADLVVEPPDKPAIPPDMPPYNPDTVLIHTDVEEWMNEQFASGKNDKMDIAVYDVQPPTRATPEPNYQCSSSGGCIVNGKEMSLEEYYKFLAEYERENPLIYRELDIPGEIKSEHSWVVSMTASEIEEFAQKYTALLIEPYKEYFNEEDPYDKLTGSGNGGNGVPPPEDTGGPRCL